MSKELFSILQEIPNPKDYPQVLTQPQRILTSKYTKDVKLELLVNRDGRLFLETYNDNTKISSREFQTPANFPIANILMNFEVSGTLFFVSCSPIQLFMCFQGTSLITPVTFPKPIPAHSSFSCHINFPSLFIFGGLDCNNRPLQDFIELNLMTFEWQNLSQSYSPSPRHSHLSYLKDDRLYVWGGLDEKNRPVDDKLLWTFDFEKSYWFALEMASPVLMDSKEFKMVERQDNRLTVLDVRDCAVYGVDVFQSAVRQEKCSRRMGLLDDNSRFVDKLIDLRDRFEGIILSKGTLYKLLIFSKYEAMMQYQMKNHMSDC